MSKNLMSEKSIGFFSNFTSHNTWDIVEEVVVKILAKELTSASATKGFLVQGYVSFLNFIIALHYYF